LNEISEMAQSFRVPGSPQELLSKQADFARRSFEAAVKNAGETADIVKKSGKESIDILRERIRESMEEIRSGFEDRK
jgi:phasin family protein